MVYTRRYHSPLGEILLAADDCGICGLWFDGQKYFARTLSADAIVCSTPMLDMAVRWLTLYFAGHNPDFLPPLHPTGTPFQQAVWKILLRIPYGQTVTYGAIARELAVMRGKKAISAQAVGGAVGRNGIAILIPCHRVVGSNGSLTGYAGGLERKRELLTLEGLDTTKPIVSGENIVP